MLLNSMKLELTSTFSVVVSDLEPGEGGSTKGDSEFGPEALDSSETSFRNVRYATSPWHSTEAIFMEIVDDRLILFSSLNYASVKLNLGGD